MTRKNAMSLGVSALMAICFALVFYAFTTPLGPSIGSDNAIYMTMGTAIKNGYAPYTEIFDHKGPLLFVLQAIPQIFSGGYSTLAIFVQQVVFLFVCLRLLTVIARELNVCEIVVQLCYLALIAKQVGGGNLTEEYTNVFTLIGLLVILRTFGAGLPDKEKGMALRAALLGAMASLCFLVRANNALVLCAMTLALALWMILEKRFALLGSCAAGFAAGMAAAALPVVLWLLAHGALAESIYGSLIHNMMYAETGGGSRLHALLRTDYGHAALLMAALSCAGACTLMKRSRPLALAMVAGAGAAGLAAFVSHKFYQHYLVLGAPLAAMGLALVLHIAKVHGQKAERLLSAGALLVCAVWLGVIGMQTHEWRLSECEGWDEYTRQAQELYALVPEEDRDEFMAYRAEPKWYVAAKALPCMRFYFLQETLANADPKVMDEIVAEFESDPPKWLVIYYNREFGPPYDARVAEIFETKYEFIDSRGTYQLKKLKEAP